MLVELVEDAVEEASLVAILRVVKGGFESQDLSEVAYKLESNRRFVLVAYIGLKRSYNIPK